MICSENRGYSKNKNIVENVTVGPRLEDSTLSHSLSLSKRTFSSITALIKAVITLEFITLHLRPTYPNVSLQLHGSI